MSRTLEVVNQSVRTKGRDTKINTKTGFLDLTMIAMPSVPQQDAADTEPEEKYELWTENRILQSKLRREAREGRNKPHTVAEVEDFDPEQHLEKMLSGKPGKKWKFWA